jgi:hypothetical protein
VGCECTTGLQPSLRLDIYLVGVSALIPIALASDTLSIAVMEILDNAIVLAHVL